MNGVHDMGGMQNFGRVVIEKNEPVFHASWEGRVYALNLALGAWRKWNLDAARYGLETLPPADYLAMSYYERWYARNREYLVKFGIVTRAELESGHAAPGSLKSTPALNAEKVAAALQIGARYNRDVRVAPRFKSGQRVRARNINLTTHTRLPRYARGKTGIVVRDYGVFVFPDTDAVFMGEKPQHVYSVRFTAQELWGEQAKPQDAVYVNMWDDYLEPA